MLGRCGPIEDVPGMPLYARWVTREECTISFDERHITKRMVRLFVNHGMTVDGVHIDVQLLRQMSKALSVATGLEAALRQKDFMSVPHALAILRAIVDVGQKKDLLVAFDAIQRKQHGAICQLISLLPYSTASLLHSLPFDLCRPSPPSPPSPS